MLFLGIVGLVILLVVLLPFAYVYAQGESRRWIQVSAAGQYEAVTKHSKELRIVSMVSILLIDALSGILCVILMKVGVPITLSPGAYVLIDGLITMVGLFVFTMMKVDHLLPGKSVQDYESMMFANLVFVIVMAILLTLFVSSSIL